MDTWRLKAQKADQMVSLRLTPRELEQLDQLSKDLGESRSMVIRLALHDYLEKEGGFSDVLDQ